MNRTSAKRGFKALLAMFLLAGGMLFFTNSVSAQSALPKLDLSGILWMTETQALDVLTNTITVTHQQIGLALPGSPVYNAGMRRAAFLKSVYGEVASGTAVPTAILNTFDQHDNSGVYTSMPAVAYTVQQARDEAEYAIAILRTN